MRYDSILVKVMIAQDMIDEARNRLTNLQNPLESDVGFSFATSLIDLGLFRKAKALLKSGKESMIRNYSIYFLFNLEYDFSFRHLQVLN